MSVVLEGRSQAETARLYGVSEGWVSKLVARYRAEGDTAFEPRSRRPRTTPAKVPAEVVELVVNLRSELSAQGLDAGAHTIAWHLQQHHQIAVSPSTIRRRLTELGLVDANPKKRPRSSYVRFEADLPNETWQSDFCHWRLSDESTVEIITWLDDCSRYALSVTAHRRITGPIVVDTFDQTCADHGLPASTLTDNAMVYTTRLSGGRGGRNALETLLADLGIEQKNSAPNHPTTCGKVERFQQTLKKRLKAQPPPPPSTNSKHSSTNSPATTTTTAPTAASTAKHPPPPTTDSPKQHPTTTAPTPTSESDTTASTNPAPSPSDTTANSTTSASAEPTNTPPSPCWSPTSTSASSTTPPANSYDA